MNGLIYTVTLDYLHYQCMLATKDEDAHKMHTTYVRPKLSGWQPPEVMIPDRRLKHGDFFSFTNDCVIANAVASNILGRFFAEAGESLPLYHEGETYTLVNVLKQYNSVDRERTVWDNSQPVNLVFKEEFNLSPGLFKTLGLSNLLVLIDPGHEDDNFVYAVESNKLEGLIFKMVWSNLK